MLKRCALVCQTSSMNIFYLLNRAIYNMNRDITEQESKAIFQEEMRKMVVMKVSQNWIDKNAAAPILGTSTHTLKLYRLRH